MAVTLDGTNIETITDIRRIQRTTVNKIKLGFRSIGILQQLKNTEHNYEVSGIWSAGATDYDSKERIVQNIIDAGLPVWLEATDWRKNAQIFGKVHDLDLHETEGSANVTEFRFLITAVAQWGYLFVQAEAASVIGQVYDIDKKVQSKDINPILRRCNWSKTSTTITFSIFVKNTGSLTGNITLEMFVPDGIVAVDITATGWTIAAGNVGDSGFSSFPGTKRRITLVKSFTAGQELQLDVTIANLAINNKTSYIDGSVDENIG